MFVALRDIFVDVLSTFSRPQKHWALNTSLSTSRLPLLHFFFCFFFSLSMLVAEKSSLKFRFIGEILSAIVIVIAT